MDKNKASLQCEYECASSDEKDHLSDMNILDRKKAYPQYDYGNAL